MVDKDNLLLSFPRSGNSWVRYFLEYLTKRPTSMGTVPDCQEGANKTDTLKLSGVDIAKRCIAIKRHRADNSWDDWNKDNTNLILLVRGWREACLRHLSIKERKDFNEVRKCAEGYVHCLRFYDEFDGNKMLVYYEDLITAPRTQIDRIVDFLQITKGQIYNEFWDNFEYNRVESIKAYPAGSTTSGAANKLKHHIKFARPKLIKEIDNVIHADLDIYKRYLKRYA